MTSHKTLRQQALLSAAKAVLTPCNHQGLNLHKPGSAIRKVTPGLHTKNVENTNIRHQILVLWKMTPNSAPRLPYQDTQTWLPDGQAAPTTLFPGIPQTHSSTCLTALHQGWPPPPPPQPPSRHPLLTNHGVQEPAHPQPRAGHPSWGGSLSNTNTKIHP